MRIWHLSACALATVVLATTCGCSSTNVAATSTSNNAKDYHACVVTGRDANVDQARAGLDKAQKDFGISTRFYVMKKNEDARSVLDRMVDQQCNLIIGVSPHLSGAVIAHARNHPTIDYALIGSTTAIAQTPPNMRNAVWDMTQPAYLAGYLAAGTAQTSSIYAFAEADNNHNRQVLSAFAQGVDRYNTDVKDFPDDSDTPKNVYVNIDAATGEGRFLGTHPDAPTVRKELTKAQQAHASVIFAPLTHHNQLMLNEVATFDSAATKKSQQSKKNSGDALSTVTLVWWDPSGTDKFSALVSRSSDDPYGAWSKKGTKGTRIPPIVTSIVLRTDIVIPKIVEDAKNTHLSNKPWSISLSNDGTGLSPYYSFDPTVPTIVKQRLATLTARFKEKTLIVTPLSRH